MRLHKRLGRLARETWKGIDQHRVTDLAAMLTYYTIFALFPFAVFLVTLTLLVLPKDILLDAYRMIAETMPGQIATMMQEYLERLVSTAGGHLAILGLLLAIWGASRGAAALQTALNHIHEVKETRPWWKVQLIALGVTLGVSFLILIAFGLLVLGPPIGHLIVDRFGLGSVFDWLWEIGRWIGAALLVMLVWACLYYFLPNIKRKFRWVTPGAVVGVLLWLGASRLFMLYVEHFGGYEKTYGTLGAIIVFLTWLWLSSLSLLIGGEIDDTLDEIRWANAGNWAKCPKPDRVDSRRPPRSAWVQLHGAFRALEPPKKELTVERVSNGNVADLAKRVADDLQTLAKTHIELARVELGGGLRAGMSDAAAVLLGGVVGLIGFAMLCATAAVALAPLIPALWLRMLIMSIVYLAVGGVLVAVFVRKLRGDLPADLRRSRTEVRRTALVLKEQVQNG